MENPSLEFEAKKFFIVSSGDAALFDICKEAGLCSSFGGSTTLFLKIANIFCFLFAQTKSRIKANGVEKAHKDDIVWEKRWYILLEIWWVFIGKGVGGDKGVNIIH